jgi:tetratricopeptide (TPR) repeat protein
MDDFAAAEDDLDRAAQLNPGETTRYAILANRGVLRYRQAQAVDSAKLIERSQPFDPLLHLSGLTVRAVRQQLLNEAADQLRQAIQLRPRDVQAHASLAVVLARQGRLRDAKTEYDSAVGLAPLLPEVYRSRAEFLAQQKDLDAAVTDLRKAIELQESIGRPEFLAADHVKIGRLLQQQAHHHEALREYDLALNKTADFPPALRLRAVALLELRRYEEASRSLDRYLEIVAKPGAFVEPTPAIAQAHQLRGLTRAQLGNYDGALSDHTIALEIQPDAPAYIARGWVYLIQGAGSSALSDFRSAVRLDPNSGEALIGQARAHGKLGQSREAVQVAETALTVGLGTPRLLLHAAIVFAQAGADVEGRQHGTDIQRPKWTRKSLDLLTKATSQLPAERRGTFWHEHVVNEPGLEPLRRLSEFQQLAPKTNR